MAARKYTIGRPIQEVRLKSWPAGKVAQFKRAIELLEGELNETMASQINQGEKRVVSPRVPKVTGLSIKAGFKNFTISFNPAKGITDLLFYEIQKSSTSSFASSTTYTVPQTVLTIPTTEEREQVYFRVRCMNSKFEVGLWSTLVSATGSSNFRITVTRQAASIVTFNTLYQDILDDTTEWVDVGGVTYIPSGASMCLHIHAGVHPFSDGLAGNSYEPVVDFRLLRNGVEFTDAGKLTCRGTFVNSGAFGGPANNLAEDAQIGTFVTPFEIFTGQEASVSYTLQARVLNASNMGGTTDQDLTVVVDCFDIVELVQVL